MWEGYLANHLFFQSVWINSAGQVEAVGVNQLCPAEGVVEHYT